MSKRKEERENAARIVDRFADNLEAGLLTHWWDAEHAPRAAEKRGRVELLRCLANEIRSGRRMAEHKDGDTTDD